MPGEMQTTVSLKAVSVGTELHLVQESLALLAKLVEADIPD